MFALAPSPFHNSLRKIALRKKEPVCGFLHLHDKNDKVIQVISSQHEEVVFEGKRGIKGTVKVVQYGPGYYTVFKGREFEGEVFQLTSNNHYILKDENFDATKIK